MCTASVHRQIWLLCNTWMCGSYKKCVGNCFVLSQVTLLKPRARISWLARKPCYFAKRFHPTTDCPPRLTSVFEQYNCLRIILYTYVTIVTRLSNKLLLISMRGLYETSRICPHSLFVEEPKASKILALPHQYFWCCGKPEKRNISALRQNCNSSVRISRKLNLNSCS